jgi:hypothetical protein
LQSRCQRLKEVLYLVLETLYLALNN